MRTGVPLLRYTGDKRLVPLAVLGGFIARWPASNNALFLYRFGVLLAANDLAHQFMSTLPQTTGQTEIGLIHQLQMHLQPAA